MCLVQIKSLSLSFVLINSHSLINAPSHFCIEKYSGQMSLNALGHQNTLFFLPTFGPKSAILGLLNCNAPGTFIRINTVKILSGVTQFVYNNTAAYFFHSNLHNLFIIRLFIYFSTIYKELDNNLNGTIIQVVLHIRTGSSSCQHSNPNRECQLNIISKTKETYRKKKKKREKKIQLAK